MSDMTGTLACRGRAWREAKRGQLLALNGNFQIDQAVLLKQPFSNVQGSLHVKEAEPEVLMIGVKAPLFEGDVSGEVRLELNSATRFNVNLTASQINLEQFGQHNLGSDSKLKGLAGGRLVLSGMGSGSSSLEG